MEKASAALEKWPMELIHSSAGLALRCGDELLLNIEMDEPRRQIHARSEIRGQRPTQTRSRGWFSEGTLRILTAPVVARTDAPASSRRNRGRKQGKRR